MSSESTDRKDAPADLRELEDRVRARLAGRVRDFRLSRGSDGLVLHGAATSFHGKQLAQEYVRGGGGRVAANEIVVEYLAAGEGET